MKTIKQRIYDIESELIKENPTIKILNPDGTITVFTESRILQVWAAYTEAVRTKQPLPADVLKIANAIGTNDNYLTPMLRMLFRAHIKYRQKPKQVEEPEKEIG